MKAQDPVSPAEWQEAVDSARFMLLMNAAVCYGLVEWEGDVDVDRCEHILRLGKRLGFAPRRDDELCRQFLR